MLRILAPLVLLVGVLVWAVASDRPAPRADFTFVNTGDVNTLDLQKMSWMQDLRVARFLFEGLVRSDTFSWGMDPEPAVAERWEVSDDRRTYTFHLRADARWSNGEPVTAGDFFYTWRRGMLPDIGSDYVNFFWLVEGAEDFYNWRVEELDRLAAGTSAYEDGAALWEATVRRFEETVGIEAPDDRTFRVTLTRPVPYFLDVAAFAVLYPVYPPLVEEYTRLDRKTGRLDSQPGWTKPGVLVSNGPFVLTQWRFKRDMRFEKNEHYWDAANVAIDSVAAPSITDPNAAVLAYESGAVDWVSDVMVAYRSELHREKTAFYAEHAEAVARMRAEGLDPIAIDAALPPDPRAHFHTFPVFGTYFWNFNCLPTLPDGRENPLADARVRRALALVIDKRAVAEQIRRMGEPPARTLIPPGSIGGYESPAGLPCISDMETEEEKAALIARARGLLSEAGWEDPSRMPVIELLFNKDSGHDLIAQSIARDWTTHLGVPTRLAQKEVKVYRNDLKSQNYMTSRAGWYGDFGDPVTFLDISRTGDGNNDRGFSDPAYDALLAQAADEPDPAARMALLAEAERLLVEEAVPMVPIFHYGHAMMFDPHRVTGLSSHPRQKERVGEVDILGDGKGADRLKVLPPRPERYR